MNNALPETPSFEDALAALERTVRDLEDGSLGLDEALARYEEGVGLLKHCYGRLRQAEQRILLLTGVGEDGQPLLQPFTHEPTAPASGVPPRRPRRRGDDLP
jgi:exodeoxyribonuclease VII small subunit